MSGIRFLVVAVALTWSATCPGQSLTVGSLGAPTGVLGPGPLTAIDFYHHASRAGSITSATFGWSAAPCPAAVKIKIFDFTAPAFHQEHLTFVDERGPFDVTAKLQTVALVPPLRVSLNSYIGITSLTTCGAPVTSSLFGPGGSLILDGDFRSDLSFGPLFGPER